ncbi:hypothetical protein BHE74_00013963 [Ensete ventricosum]|nr:hypothetical protein BHE74_00013963 [Ensete ventricosum]
MPLWVLNSIVEGIDTLGATSACRGHSWSTVGNSPGMLLGVRGRARVGLLVVVPELPVVPVGAREERLPASYRRVLSRASKGCTPAPFVRKEKLGKSSHATWF